MDAKIISYTENGSLIMDLKVVNGIAILITGEEEALQNAQLAGFIPRNGVPQLKNNPHGIDWAGFLTEATKFGEIDAQIRDNLGYVGLADMFYPDYSIENGKLNLTIKKEVIS